MKLEYPKLGFSEMPRSADELGVRSSAALDQGIVRRQIECDENDIVLATPSQKRLWYLEKITQNVGGHNIQSCFQLKGSFDEERLTSCLQMMVDRHQVLRTAIVDQKGTPAQRIEKTIPFQITHLDLAPYKAALLEEKIKSALEDLVLAPFDLAVAPLWRFTLIRTDSDEFLLSLVFHNIIYDGFSEQVFIRELSSIYGFYDLEKIDAFGHPDLQFAGFAIWQDKWIGTVDYQRQLDYWLDHLSGELPVLNTPSDYVRPAIRNPAAASLSLRLPTDIVLGLNELSRQTNISLQVVLLSLFSIFLARYSSSNDVVVGVPISGRERPGFKNAIGYFSNMLPLFFRFEWGMIFNDFLSKAQEVFVNGCNNSMLPFDSLVEMLKPPRDASRTPIFQAIFDFESLAELGDDFSLGEASVKPYAFEEQSVQADIFLTVKKYNNNIDLKFFYSKSLFLQKTAQHMLDGFAELLNSAVNNLASPISLLSMQTPNDRQILSKINHTEEEWPDLLLPDLISQQAKASPDKVAAHFSDGNVLSYGGLERKVDGLAFALVERGVEPGDLVGLCMDRDQHMLVSLLAILKVGAAYIALDPAYPKDRLAFMVEVSSLKLILVTGSVEQSIGDFDSQKFYVDRDWEDINLHSKAFVSRATETGLAYVIFTSGSTGKPKGVMVPHRALINFLLAMQQKPGFTSDNCLLAVTTLSFDIAVLELYLPLISGGTLVIASKEQAIDSDQLCKTIDDYDVDVMQATPTTWRGLLSRGFVPKEGFKALCGGEAFPEDLAEQMASCCSQVWNMYGPTETTVWSTCYRLSSSGLPVLIGQPIANTQCYILDEEMQQVAIGIRGELYIGGDGVTQGYLSREDLTQERFIANPFGSGLLYRTGDVARVRDDGNLEYVNRLDNQVKVRGFRIELGEIEAAIVKHEFVAQVVVNSDEISAVDKRLVAYVKFVAGCRLTNTDIRNYLRESLPDYMLPQLMVEMTEFPLTPNGKIDRKMLPSPFSNIEQQVVHCAPETFLEKRIAEIWASHLGVDTVGLTDNFFDLGGHSLMSMLVLNQIEGEFSVKLTAADIAVNSLEQLVLRIENAQPLANTTAVSEVNPMKDGKARQGFWRKLLRK